MDLNSLAAFCIQRAYLIKEGFLCFLFGRVIIFFFILTAVFNTFSKTGN